ncbi:MAG: SAP domain-containing protein [Ilumatobacteraceae bacterium]
MRAVRPDQPTVLTTTVDPEIVIATAPPPDYESMKKAELVEVALAQNIETSGLTKAEIIDRLQS